MDFHYSNQPRNQQQQNQTPKYVTSARSVRSSSTFALLLFFLAGAIGVVTPFAGGSTADFGGNGGGGSPTSSSSSSRHNFHRSHRTGTHQPQSQNLHYLQNPATTTTTTTTSVTTRTSTALSSSADRSPLFRNPTSTLSQPHSSRVSPLFSSTASTTPPTPTKKSGSGNKRSILRQILGI